jgi:hypothetical protein
VAGKLRLAWHRRVTGWRCDLRSWILFWATNTYFLTILYLVMIKVFKFL